jgi:hypothetical protein
LGIHGWGRAVREHKVEDAWAFFNNTASTKRFQFTGVHDQQLRNGRGYWVHVADSETSGGNITLKGVGGSYGNETIPWASLNFTNGTTMLNITQAFEQGWIGLRDTEPADDWIKYWDTSDPLGGHSYQGIPSSQGLFTWKGYFLWSRQSNITLLQPN